MPIRKGSIYWVDFSSDGNPGTNILRPALVIQNDILNSSKLNTVSLLAITSILKFGELPGNVILEKGEANLPQSGVINVTQIRTVKKSCLREMIGSLTKERLDQVEVRQRTPGVHRETQQRGLLPASLRDDPLQVVDRDDGLVLGAQRGKRQNGKKREKSFHAGIMSTDRSPMHMESSRPD